MRRSMRLRSACRALGESKVNRVGRLALSRISPPLDQTNGATRMIVGSTPSPYTATRGAPASDSVPLTTAPSAVRVSAEAVAIRSFQVQPAFGSATPYLLNRV